METGILHTHHLIVLLYMVQLLVKVILVVSGNTSTLTKVMAKTKVLHMVLATLMLLTGVFLVFKAPIAFTSTFYIKYILVLVAIALGIVGVKKMNKALAISSMLCMLYIYALTLTKGYTLQPEETRVKNALLATGTDAKARGQVIYEQLCLRCHGAEGQAHYRKAAILANCTKGDDYIRTTVTQGREKMPAFPFLNDEEKSDLLAYINTLIKK